MTDDELTAIEARAHAATAGPWGYTYDGSSDWSVGPAEDPQSGQIACCHRRRAVGNPDAEFIAHARTDVPALLAEARRCRDILTAIIYASDGCVGHKACNHSLKPWKDARAHLGLLRDGETVPNE